MSGRRRPEEYGHSGWTRRTFSLLPRRLMRFEDHKRKSGGLVIGWFHDGWGWGFMDAYFTACGEDRYRMAIPGLTVRLGGSRKAGEVDHRGDCNTWLLERAERRAFLRGMAWGVVWAWVGVLLGWIVWG